MRLAAVDSGVPPVWHRPFTGAHCLAGTARTAEVLRRPWADPGLLSSSEQARAAGFRTAADRDDFTAAHLLARRCAARFAGVPTASVKVVQECAECGTQGHGQPRADGLPALHLSMSHARGRVAAAAGSGPVGVDVEGAEGAGADPRLHARVLSGPERALVGGHPCPERAFLRLWVRKEALVKIGEASLLRLAETDVRATPAPRSGPPGSLLLTDWWDAGLDAHVALACRRSPTATPHPGPPPPTTSRTPAP